MRRAVPSFHHESLRSGLKLSTGAILSYALQLIVNIYVISELN
jgi:hypothetical protein